ncbi:hypothetical protein BYI23_E002210 (plasmid) [Burkholderia sp. YI23]|nr:hypothetical protein BYI23_E002210 [Burkholderia sp. YI23]
MMEKIEAAINVVLDLIRKGATLTMALSGGKDSMTTTLLCMEAIRRAKLEGVQQSTHYVTSASTGVENPAMESHLLDIHDEIAAYVWKTTLPIEVKLAHPSIASSFVVSTIGRGTLPRFPENSKHRSCSVDWKVRSQQRLASELLKSATSRGFHEPIAVIGTRFSESAIRAVKMSRRGESSVVPVRDVNGRLSLSLIAEWELQDVWDLLELFLDPATAPFPTFTDGASIYRLFELYREANEGACGINLGDGGNKAPCGPRFGCWVCTIAGQSDKSMESMLREPRHQYMRGLNDFRNLLMATQFDLSRRELVGRQISEAGYLPVRPDVYSLAFRRDLLAYLITLDVLEEERAEQMDADICAGRVPDTRENRRLTTPQFENVVACTLVAVDFQWSMHHYAPHAFPAVSLWYEIRILGRRFPVPKLETFPKSPIPAKRWFPVGSFDRDAPTDGLRDYKAEQWNPYLHPERPLSHRQVNGERTVWFEEEDGLEVDAERACQFVTCEYESMMIESRQHSAIESARFWLNEEIVKLPSGMAARYQHIAKRGQYFAHLTERLNCTAAELDAYLVKHSISDAEHSKLISEAPEPEVIQGDLFSMAA